MLARSASALAVFAAAACSTTAGGPPTPAVAPAHPVEPNQRATDLSAPTALPPFLLAVGRHHTCAQRDASGVWCWGLDHLGQLGVDRSAPACDPARKFCARPQPVRGLGVVDALALGSFFSCALADGRVRCWGDIVDSDTPQEVVGLSGAVQIAAGGSTLCALRGNGSIACAGTPTDPPATLRAESICVGGSHACAVTDDDELFCWGSEDARARGLASDDAILSDVAQVACGNDHVCALHDDGTIDCWGWGAALDTDADVATPTRWTMPPARHLSAGWSGTCALSSRHEARCWGGWGLSPSAHLVDVEHIGVGEFHACAAFAGRVRCWGVNTYGVLGDGTEVDRASPVHVRW